MATTFAVGHGALPHGGEVMASTARTATESSADMGNLGGAGLIVVIDMTVDPGADTVTFSIEGKDPVSGEYYPLLSSAALTDVASTVLQVHPALTVVANEAASALVPAVWRVTATHSGATTTTYSVGATLTP